jgi:transposase
MDKVPVGVHLVWLPPYSPELQPAERLWPLTNEPLANEPLANRSFADLAELEAVQAQRCLTLQAQPERVRAATLFHWWPLVA